MAAQGSCARLACLHGVLGPARRFLWGPYRIALLSKLAYCAACFKHAPCTCRQRAACL